MGEVTVEVDGVKRTFYPEDCFVCDHCGCGWWGDEEFEVCPECGDDSGIVLESEEISIRPKWLWDGAETIEQMVARTEHEAEVLRELQRDGWSLTEPPRDGYAYLMRPVEKSEDSDETTVVLSE